jgi:DNA-binding transcriptional ArsR family regulator
MTGPAGSIDFAQHALALTSGAWAELGVPGRTRSHGDWGIDLEPLILFTAWIGGRDAQLYDDATDWCIRNVRFVSKTRLKNLLGLQPHDVQATFGVFAATVEAHSGVVWPAATQPGQFRPHGVSPAAAQPAMSRASLSWLRMRAMFGIGARAEILRCLLSCEAAMSVVRLATATGYTKRNIADECDTLQRAGVLSVRRRGNRFYYSLARRAELVSFVGDLPAVRPDWTAIFNVARGLVTLEHGAEVLTERTLAIQARRTLRLLQGDLDELGITRPSDDVESSELWAALHRLGSGCLEAWSDARWPGPKGISPQ